MEFEYKFGWILHVGARGMFVNEERGPKREVGGIEMMAADKSPASLQMRLGRV